jgi:hypothetical protein
MGLDIYAISQIKKSVEETDLSVYDNGFNRIGGLEPGFYEKTNKTTEHQFRAGSYSSYNWFRNQLSLCIFGQSSDKIWENPDVFVGRPFYELIDFSDCDGCFGPEASERLHQDFVNNRQNLVKYCIDKYIDNDDTYDYIIETYDNFTTAFELGKQTGLVQFC